MPVKRNTLHDHFPSITRKKDSWWNLILCRCVCCHQNRSNCSCCHTYIHTYIHMMQVCNLKPEVKKCQALCQTVSHLFIVLTHSSTYKDIFGLLKALEDNEDICHSVTIVILHKLKRDATRQH